MSEQRNEQRPENLNDARQAMRRRRRRRLKIVRTSIVLGIVLLLLLVGALITWKVIADQQSARRETTSFFPVRGIVVEGQTRYSHQELIEKSGLYVGQSLMGVNKVHAHELLVQNFPYLETVDIGNASFDTLRIRVTETKVMAAVQVDQVWYIVGESNKALEQVGPNDVPENTLQVVGATVVGRTVGASLMDDRSLRVCRTLVAAAQQYNLQGMTAVDMTEKTNLCIMLNDRLQVVLGNETNITAQIQMLADTLPVLYKNNGTDVSGRLDMTTYADDDPGNNKVIFTPTELLQEENTAVGTTPTEGTATAGTTTTTAG